MAEKNFFEQFDTPAAPNGVIITKPTTAKSAAETQIAQAQARNADAIQSADARYKVAQATKMERDAATEDNLGNMDEATKRFYAQQVLAGAPMPAIGMGKQAAANRQAIMEEVARIGGAAGLTGTDQAAQIAHYKAGSKQISNLETMAGTIGVNEQTALANGQQYIDRSAELPGQTSIAPLNAVSNAIQRMFGGTTISRADAAYNTFTNEYAKVVAGSPSGAGTLSDSARHEAMSTINGSGSVAQKQAAFEQMKADMANRMVAIHGGINNAYKALTAQPGYQVPDSTQGLAAANPASSDRHDPALPWNGTGTGAGAGPNGPPPSGGGPTNPYGYDPNSPQGDPRGTLTATSAQYLNQSDPKAAGIIDSMIRSGASADKINAAIRPLGYPGVDAVQVQKAQDYLKTPAGRAYKGSLGGASRYVEQGANERAGNALGLSNIGAGAIGAYDGLNSLTFGGLGAASDALTGLPGQSALAAQAAGQAHPFAKGAGEVVGTLPAFLGGEAALGRLAPALGGSATMAGRVAASPLTADAAAGSYSSAGAADPGNRLQAGAIGAVATPLAGMFGRGLARGVGGALTGVQNGAVRLLRDQGVPMTAGQTLSQSGLAGRVVKGAEDRLSSVPIVGDMVNARRTESLRGFNRAAFDEGLRPINATTGGLTGTEGIDAARAARSTAYSNALDPVNVQADAPFVQDMAGAIQRGRALPDPMASNLDYTLPTRVGNSFGPNGELTGRDFQQSIRGLRRDAKGVESQPYGHDFGEVTGSAEDALRGLLDRQAPDALGGFDAANAANRNVEVLRSAVTSARNGTRSGETDLFAPSQLSDAASANARKFGNTNGTTNQPFYDLTRAGQAVLPSKVPDSGTAGRLALLALPAVLGGAGGGAGHVGGDTAGGAEAGLGLGAALALAGTRGGQSALTRLLADRPDLLVRVGQQVNNRAAIGGMFGSALAPSLLSQ